MSVRHDIAWRLGFWGGGGGCDGGSRRGISHLRVCTEAAMEERNKFGH